VIDKLKMLVLLIFVLSRKIFTLYLQFCTSLIILLKLVLRKNDVRGKKKISDFF